MSKSITPVVPSRTWEDLIAVYTAFISWPAWFADGEEKPGGPPEIKFLMTKRLARLRASLPAWPKTPGDFKQKHVALLFPDQDPKAPRTNPARSSGKGALWTAIILDRDRYTCCWCGRSAFDVYAAEMRTLRLQLDHYVPRAQGGATLDLGNVRTACKSCNTLRGQLPEGKTLRELESLAKAVAMRAKS